MNQRDWNVVFFGMNRNFYCLSLHRVGRGRGFRSAQRTMLPVEESIKAFHHDKQAATFLAVRFFRIKELPAHVIFPSSFLVHKIVLGGERISVVISL